MRVTLTPIRTLARLSGEPGCMVRLCIKPRKLRSIARARFVMMGFHSFLPAKSSFWLFLIFCDYLNNLLPCNTILEQISPEMLLMTPRKQLAFICTYLLAIQTICSFSLLVSVWFLSGPGNPYKTVSSYGILNLSAIFSSSALASQPFTSADFIYLPDC